MRPLLSIKTLYRSPIKTLLTFILLAVVTFAFFSQTAEYAVTSREFNNAAKQYSGVGSAEVAPPADSYPRVPSYINADLRVAQFFPEERKERYLSELRYQPLTQVQLSQISALPYITSTDTRYMAAGISDTYDRLDDGMYFYNYSARCVIEGSLAAVKYGNPEAIGDVQNGFNKLMIEDCTLIAGSIPWSLDDIKFTIFADPLSPPENSGSAIGVTMGRPVSAYNSSYIYDTEFVQNMTPGSRYVFVLRFEPLADQSFYLGDELSDPWCHAIWPMEGAPENYLETDRFTPLRELVEITNADAHTFDMVYTEDMNSILRFAEGSMAIMDGRAINREDSANGLNVCVVSRDFATANKLKVGDTITMKLGTELFEQYKGLGAVAVVRERYKPAEKTVTLEIVGIYTDIDGTNTQSRQPHWSYSINTMFVPKSLLPLDESRLTDHVFSPVEFSFKIDNAWDIPAFLEESSPLFEEMGLKCVFFDDGWPDIAQSFQSARQLSIIKIAVLSAAVAAATVFVVYLFISRKKKEYAVMRALGTTRKVSARALILPLTVVALTAVLAGSAAAWIYTVKTIAHNNTLSLLKEYSVSTAVPAEAVIGCIMGEILLTLVFALLLLRRVGAISPLSLLQGNGSRHARIRQKTNRAKPAGIEVKPLTMSDSNVPLVINPPFTDAAIESPSAAGVPEPVRAMRKSRSVAFVLRYIWKHMRRSLGKSALSVLLAALLFAAVGQLALMKQSYTQLCIDTVIKANFVGGLPLTAVPQIMSSGYVIDPYYEAAQTVDLNFSREGIVYTNNIARYTGEEAEVIYADGYDASIMDQLGNCMIVGNMLMMKYGLETGDTVTITPENFLKNLQSGYIQQYRGAQPADDITDEEILVLYQDEITRLTNYVAIKYVIAGVVSTPSGRYDDLAFTPGSNKTSQGSSSDINLDVAEFTLADNFRTDEFRNYGGKMAGGSVTSGVVLVMDTSKLENLKNSLRLLEMLYPVALTAALLIGGFLCCLVIIQSSKEAAIMRILGTTKRRTRTILALEQLFLSIAGLIMGACGLLLYKGPALSVISAQLLLFAALYFTIILISAVIFSSLATRRNVLELLQTKE